MLDKIIKEQLDKLEVARVSAYSEEKHRYLFKKIEQVNLKIGTRYLLQLNKNLINGEMNGVLVNNWNHGKVPTHTLLNVEVKEKLGTMFLVSGFYLNDDYTKIENETWEGWFPIEQVSVLKEIE